MEKLKGCWKRHVCFKKKKKKKKKKRHHFQDSNEGVQTKGKKAGGWVWNEGINTKEGWPRNCTYL